MSLLFLSYKAIFCDFLPFEYLRTIFVFWGVIIFITKLSTSKITT